MSIAQVLQQKANQKHARWPDDTWLHWLAPPDT